MTLVLLADDDRDIRDLVAFRLEQSGYTAVSTDDGTQALAAARHQRPDIALLDVSMPA